mgnify:CR=1 FL=1
MSDFFKDQARLGKMFHAHNTTAGAVTVLSATCTGLVLSNPLGSGKDLIVSNMSFVGSTLSTIAEIGVAVSSSVAVAVQTGTAAVVHNARLGGSNGNIGVGQALSIATLLSTPVWLRPIGSARVTGTTEGTNAFEADFDGELVVTPGTYVCFSTLTAARTGLCSVSWAEADRVS